MRIAVFEDNDSKFEKISLTLNDTGVSNDRIVRIRYLGEFLRLDKRNFDFCIMDLKMPLVSGGEARDAAGEVLKMVEEACDFSVPVVAITEFSELAKSHTTEFAKKGCLILDYEDEEVWTSALSAYVGKAEDRHRYQFIILTAIESERQAYSRMEFLDIVRIKKCGMEFWETTLEGKRGAIVCLPRMGLVNAAVVATRILENYSPRIICMSGICAGVGKDIGLGQLLVTEICWEYQTGKWLNRTFKSETYQEKISPELRTELSMLLGDRELLPRLEEGMPKFARPTKVSKPRFALVASGSAVVGSAAKIRQIKGQHRKLEGLDMELYGFHRAVALTSSRAWHFSAKTVVDKANSKKNNKLHSYGAYISAKFCLETIGKCI